MSVDRRGEQWFHFTRQSMEGEEGTMLVTPAQSSRVGRKPYIIACNLFVFLSTFHINTRARLIVSWLERDLCYKPILLNTDKDSFLGL